MIKVHLIQNTINAEFFLMHVCLIGGVESKDCRSDISSQRKGSQRQARGLADIASELHLRNFILKVQTNVVQAKRSYLCVLCASDETRSKDHWALCASYE